MYIFLSGLRAMLLSAGLLTEHQCNARGSKRRQARLKSAAQGHSIDIDQMSDKASSSSGNSSPSEFSPSTSPLNACISPMTSYSSSMSSQITGMQIDDKTGI